MLLPDGELKVIQMLLHFLGDVTAAVKENQIPINLTSNTTP